jgi:phage internal scaffolding protein
MAFRKYDADGKQLGLDKGGHVFEETKTEQSHKAEVDINNIVKRAGNMELIAKVSALQNFVYDDVTNNDFQEAMNAIIKAKETFSSVPSGIRRQFDNDPAKFMDFVHNPDNADKLVEMGLANAPVVEEPIQVVVTNPPETPPVDPQA